MVKRVLTGRCAGGMNPSPTGCGEREIVGRPDLRPPRACMGVRVISSYLCRGAASSTPRRGGKPPPYDAEDQKVVIGKCAGRACPAPTGVAKKEGQGKHPLPASPHAIFTQVLHVSP